jgi:plasmid stabilization system protein ParE
MSYVLSEDAERDLHGIWDFIAADNTEAADRSAGRSTLSRILLLLATEERI